jgi:hypothetical protein
MRVRSAKCEVRSRLRPFVLCGLLLGLCTSYLVLRTSAAAVATPDAAVSTADADPRAHRAAVLEHLGVPGWHAAGYRGRGFKVAILDSGFCGYRAHLGKALPARVQARSFRLDGNLEARDSQHGILCGEVVHALAPEAELLFANWEPDLPERFLEAVRWARGRGARVISCSVIMPTWSDGEGHGTVHEGLSRILGRGDRADDILFLASAGNTAQRHWGGPFRDGGDGWHEWAPGQTANAISPWGDERVSVELCWHGPGGYEMVVRDTTEGREVGRSDAPASTAGNHCAVVAFTADSEHRYTLRVRRVGPTAGSFHVVVLGGGLRYPVRRGSIPFPGDGPEVVAVGAVGADGRRLAYSSCGPNSPRPKPDLVAPVPFPSLWRSRPFAGTSAAAPQAAALAVLLWSRHPDWTPLHVRATLCSAARHAGTTRPNYDTGYGQIHLP